MDTPTNHATEVAAETGISLARYADVHERFDEYLQGCVDRMTAEIAGARTMGVRDVGDVGVQLATYREVLAAWRAMSGGGA